MILGSGPNRIGQGIEFDYCCCHAAFAMREEGFETVMINCNPETVSTDYDTVDRLYFEPLTFEDVSAIVAREQEAGADVACVVQYGGQTPLKLALPLQAAGIKIIGTSPDSIDLAEDRERFAKLLWELGIPQAPSGTATTADEARQVAATIGFPLVVRPSYVLGGRAMAIVYDVAALDRYMTHAVDASPGHPILIDKFLEDAFELDVDAIADATGAVVIGGIMEHIEEAGIHSGDSSCVVPPYLVAERHVSMIRDYTRRIAKALKVVGLMNAQFAIKDDTVYVLEVNPRASRTVPYLSKATGLPLAKVAARVMIGKTLAQLGLTEDLEVSGYFVKTPVFPFVRFPGVDTILGPEMKSTGEVMGGAATFGSAFAKAQLAAGVRLPTEGAAFISVNNHDKPSVVQIARALRELGFRLVATRGNRELSPRPRHRGGDRLQDQRRTAARRRRDSEQSHPARHQHGARKRIVLRRSHGASHRHDARRPVHYHPHRCGGYGQRHQSHQQRRPDRARAAGIPRRNCRGSDLGSDAVSARRVRPVNAKDLRGLCRTAHSRSSPGPASFFARRDDVRAPAALAAVPFLVGTATALLLWPRLSSEHIVCGVGAASLALLAAAAEEEAPSVCAALVIGFLFAGLSLGIIAAERAYRSPLAEWYETHASAEPVILEGVLREDAAQTPFGASVALDIERVGSQSVTGGVRLSIVGALALGASGDWRRGRRVRVTATLRTPSDYHDPGVPELLRPLARRGVCLVGSVKSATLVERLADCVVHARSCRQRPRMGSAPAGGVDRSVERAFRRRDDGDPHRRSEPAVQR